ncbi:MAG TPA: hypothetical protein VJ481_01910 [Patescibacteria group bacterium]|nr:hypothetical protein [Patescibacteria group bacterium]
MKKNIRMFSKILMFGSFASIILAGFGYLYQDIWLASTQWLLVAAVLALFGVYAKLES